MISKVIYSIVDLGTQVGHSERRNQIARLLNKICLFVIFMITPYMLMTFYFKSMSATLVQLGAIAALGCVIFLNGHQYFNLARILTLAIGNLHIFYMALLLGRESGVYFYFSAAVIAPLFFYTPEEKKYIGVFSTLTIILAIVIHLLGSEFKPLFNLPNSLLTVFFYFSVFGSQASVFAFVYYFYHESNRFEQTLKLLNKKLQKLSDTDPLTQLPNRRCFFGNLEREWRRGLRQKKPISIIMMDIDYFKRFNDFYGHQAGDQCLEKIGNLIDKNTREFTDFPARYGGEEFIILLTDTNLTSALEIAHRIRKKIMNLAIVHEQNTLFGVVTGSFGVAGSIPEYGKASGHLIKPADDALYQAKEKGRNTVVVAKI